MAYRHNKIEGLTVDIDVTYPKLRVGGDDLFQLKT